MYARIQIALKKHEFEALQTLAEREYRGTKAQIELLLHDALIERGLLTNQAEQPGPDKTTLEAEPCQATMAR